MKGVKFEDNSRKVLKTFKSRKKSCIIALGEKAVSIWTKEITRLKIVDTGRYRASTAWQQIKEDELAVGSNVEYAPSLELGSSKTKARPSLKISLLNYKDVYKKIVENIMKG